MLLEDPNHSRRNTTDPTGADIGNAAVSKDYIGMSDIRLVVKDSQSCAIHMFDGGLNQMK